MLSYVQIVSTLLCMVTLAGLSTVFANTLSKNDWSIGYFIPTLVAIAITAVADPVAWVLWVRHCHLQACTSMMHFQASCPMLQVTAGPVAVCAASVNAALHLVPQTSLQLFLYTR